MEINTCEQYVLSRLSTVEEELAKLRSDYAMTIKTLREIFYVDVDPSGAMSINLQDGAFAPPDENDADAIKALETRTTLLKDLFWNGIYAPSRDGADTADLDEGLNFEAEGAEDAKEAPPAK